MIERYSQWVIRWRYFIILATLVLVGLTTLGFPLKFDTDYRVFFSEENPQLVAFEDLQSTYTKNDNVLIVLAPKNGRVFTQETLEVVENLTHEAWQIPYSIRVDSITNFQHTYAHGDDLTVEDLVSNAKTLSEADMVRAKKVALSEPMLINKLISPKAHVTAINVTVQLPSIHPEAEVPEIVEFVRELADKVRANSPHLDVYLTGVVMMNNSFPEAAQSDMRTLFPALFLMIIVILWLLLRGLSGVFSTILVVIFSTISALGLAGLIGIALTGPSSTAPIMILTLAVADSVHFLVTLRHEMWENGREKHQAIVESLRVNFQPIFLTSLTTAIGFLSMNFGEVPPFHDLGNIVATGVMIAFVLSVSLLPALMAILPVRKKQQSSKNTHLMDRLGDFVVARQRLLMWGMAGVILFLIAFVPRNELNDVFVEYFDDSFAFRRATDFTTENLTGTYDIHYSLGAGESQGISDPLFLQKVAAFTDWYREQPEVTHVNTITDTFKRLNKNMHGDDPTYYRLPEQRDLAAQYLLLYEMSLPYGLDLNNQINIDKSATRIAITLKTLSTNELLALEERVQQWLKENGLPAMQVPGASTSIMFANIGSRNIRSMLLGAALALILISLILIFALRSLKFGLISLIPNLVPTLMAFGLWGLLVGQVGLGLSVVAGLTIGIVVDDTIHYLSKYLRARREKALDPEDAVRYAFHSVGLALWVTSLALVAGFAILSQSHFYLNSSMGIMTAVTIAFALMTDFLFLPPLLMKLDKKTT
ncbi:MMPL family transporter [Candidatus Marithioploca araucensis]|uniref:MMPL family transporter n=1 Tax=Candidatus Marithioploca araucensis TaxID=70273 RepID=A0ABT7VRZ2_9GAMM|nr:MMPL family transporter [Candidatus Marithioploca araucensis]